MLWLNLSHSMLKNYCPKTVLVNQIPDDSLVWPQIQGKQLEIFDKIAENSPLNLVESYRSILNSAFLFKTTRISCLFLNLKARVPLNILS